jgi:D-alanyl-D-alanine carboxypeptidase
MSERFFFINIFGKFGVIALMIFLFSKNPSCCSIIQQVKQIAAYNLIVLDSKNNQIVTKKNA